MARKLNSASNTPSNLFLIKNLRSQSRSKVSCTSDCVRRLPLLARGRLLCQFRTERLFALGNITLVPHGIDERIRPTCFHPSILRLHAVVISKIGRASCRERV